MVKFGVRARLCAAAFFVAAGAATAAIGANNPLRSLDEELKAKVHEIEVKEEQVRAHVMRPPHVIVAHSDKGKLEGEVIARKFPPFKIKPYLDVKGFGNALHAALKDSTIGYVMRLQQHGQTIYTLEWNWAKTPADSGVGWNPQKVMHVASVSKLITAIAMTKALDDHHISYDAKIADYLPTYWHKGPGVANISFRNLLTETGGFGTTSDETDYAFMKSQVSAGAPTVGQYGYLNMNFGLCRILIPIINGNVDKDASFTGWAEPQDQVWDYVTVTAYQTYVKNHVFNPAGVSDAALTHADADALAYDYQDTGHGWNSGDLTSVAGGAGWHVSVDDLLKIMGTLRRGGSIMSDTKAQGMLDAGFGLDVIQSTPLGTLYNKNGLWWDGQHVEQSLVYFLPDDMELVVLTNSPVGPRSASAQTGKFFRSVVTNIYLDNIKG
jgi:CubicO group peptidase (beta-lactamase class C family)